MSVIVSSMDGINQSGALPGPDLNNSTAVEQTGQAFAGRQVAAVRSAGTEELDTGPELSTRLNSRTAAQLSARHQLTALLEKHAPQQEVQNKALLDVLVQNDAIKKMIDSDQPLPQKQIDQLEAVLPGLRELHHKGSTVENLKWHIDGQLTSAVDLSNSDQLGKLTRTNLKNFAAQIHDKAASNPELVSLASDIDKKMSELGSLSPKDQCGQCHKLLEQMLPHLPEADHDVAKLLQTQLKSQALAEIKNEFKQQLLVKLNHLNRAGTEREVAVAFELGLAASAFGMDALGAAIKVEYKFNAKSLDSAQITDDHSFSATLNLSAGNNATVRGDAAVTGTVKSGKMFRSLESYVDHHANDMLPLLLEKKLTAIKSRIHSAKGAHSASKADKTGQLAKADLTRLQTMLQANGTLPASQKLTLPAAPEKKYLDSRSTSIKGSLSGSALEGMLRGEFHVANTRSDYYQKHGWLETLKADPEHLEYEPAKYFSMQNNSQWLEGKEGEQWLDKMGNDIAFAKGEYNRADIDIGDREVAAIMVDTQREQLRESMAALYAEYDHYCAIVNQMEGSGDSDLKGDIKDLKHRLEKSRGANGRGEYLRAVLDTHAAMANLHSGSFKNGPPAESRDLQFEALQRKFEQDYSQPRIQLQESKHIRKHLSSFSKAEGKELEAGGNFSVTVGPVQVDAGFRLSNVSHHFNPDTEGKYLNVNFSAGLGTNPQQALTAVLKTLPQASGAGGSFFVDSLPSNFSYGSYRKANFEVNFIWSEGGWRVQYMRASGKTGIGGGTPEATIPVAPGLGLKAKVEAAISGTDNIWERLGTNTLTYFFTRYNGWSAAGNNPEYWSEFKSHNQSRMKDLFKNMANPESCVSKELDSKLKEIGDDKLTTELKDALAAHNKQPNHENYLKALGLFDTFMDKQHETYKQFVKGRFKPT
ncbi:hypothetical protein EOPP23_03150 [Endozoicomonas sp. OPT23]|uniref:hypothetical protein n=1 Tax=Endozoicomonas sp. OPT23 TaxID=2072845 RepID=UPI00129A96AB|nr:hypothetical protein [Endozoicomonas sp. OPT23]MRI31995.1 hypothetical protein [Endozoicomonas sp. OPT23]